MAFPSGTAGLAMMTVMPAVVMAVVAVLRSNMDAESGHPAATPMTVAAAVTPIAMPTAAPANRLGNRTIRDRAWREHS